MPHVAFIYGSKEMIFWTTFPEQQCYLPLIYGRKKKIHSNGTARNYPICLYSQTLPFSAVPVKGMYLTDLLSTSQKKILFSLPCETCLLIL